MISEKNDISLLQSNSFGVEILHSVHGSPQITSSNPPLSQQQNSQHKNPAKNPQSGGHQAQNPSQPVKQYPQRSTRNPCSDIYKGQTQISYQLPLIPQKPKKSSKYKNKQHREKFTLRPTKKSKIQPTTKSRDNASIKETGIQVKREDIRTTRSNASPIQNDRKKFRQIQNQSPIRVKREADEKSQSSGGESPTESATNTRTIRGIKLDGKFWTEENDRFLLDYASKFKCDWKKVSKKFKVKKFTPTFLKIRFKELTKAPFHRRKRFSHKEDLLIAKYYQRFNSDWDTTVKYFKDRTTAMLKNRFYAFVRQPETWSELTAEVHRIENEQGISVDDLPDGEVEQFEIKVTEQNQIISEKQADDPQIVKKIDEKESEPDSPGEEQKKNDSQDWMNFMQQAQSTGGPQMNFGANGSMNWFQNNFQLPTQMMGMPQQSFGNGGGGFPFGPPLQQNTNPFGQQNVQNGMDMSSNQHMNAFLFSQGFQAGYQYALKQQNNKKENDQQNAITSNSQDSNANESTPFQNCNKASFMFPQQEAYGQGYFMNNSNNNNFNSEQYWKNMFCFYQAYYQQFGGQNNTMNQRNL